MNKTLLLLIAGLTLATATRAPAQAFTDQVRLPGTLPGIRTTATAAQTGSVSQLQELLVQNFSAGAWVDFARNTYLNYRTATLPGLIRIDHKSGSSWQLFSAHRYRYTSAGEIQSDTLDQYEQAPFGAYVALVGVFNTPSQVRRQWNTFREPGSTAPWDSLNRLTHTYNAAGQRTQILEEFYSSGTFQNSARRLWTYNALGQIAVYESQTAPKSGPDWGPLQRVTFVYNAAGHMQQATGEIANTGGTAYLNSTRSTVRFDGQGRESVLTADSWENGAWQLYSQTLYAYNATGDLASATLQLWNGTAFQNAQRLLFTYAQVLGTRPTAATHQLLAVAPNPSAAGAPARLLLTPDAAGATGGVYDQLDRQVAALTCPPVQAARGFLLLPAGLTPGLYVVRLQAGARQWQARWDQR